MTETLADLLSVIHKSRNIRPDDVGLGKNEIHPVAQRLSRETDELFQEATFRSGYRGVRSPEIRQALSYFEYGVDCEVLEEGEDQVDHSDEYYYLEKEEDVKIARSHLEELEDSTKDAIEEALDDLDRDWLGFVQSENDEINEKVQADIAD